MTAEFLVEIERPILEVVREERDLDLLAELPGRRLIELDRPETVAGASDSSRRGSRARRRACSAALESCFSHVS